MGIVLILISWLIVSALIIKSNQKIKGKVILGGIVTALSFLVMVSCAPNQNGEVNTAQESAVSSDNSGAVVAPEYNATPTPEANSVQDNANQDNNNVNTADSDETSADTEDGDFSSINIQGISNIHIENQMNGMGTKVIGQIIVADYNSELTHKSIVEFYNQVVKENPDGYNGYILKNIDDDEYAYEFNDPLIEYEKLDSSGDVENVLKEYYIQDNKLIFNR